MGGCPGSWVPNPGNWSFLVVFGRFPGFSEMSLFGSVFEGFSNPGDRWKRGAFPWAPVSGPKPLFALRIETFESLQVPPCCRLNGRRINIAGVGVDKRHVHFRCTVPPPPPLSPFRPTSSLILSKTWPVRCLGIRGRGGLKGVGGVPVKKWVCVFYCFFYYSSSKIQPLVSKIWDVHPKFFKFQFKIPSSNALHLLAPKTPTQFLEVHFQFLSWVYFRGALLQLRNSYVIIFFSSNQSPKFKHFQDSKSPKSSSAF